MRHTLEYSTQQRRKQSTVQFGHGRWRQKVDCSCGWSWTVYGTSKHLDQVLRRKVRVHREVEAQRRLKPRQLELVGKDFRGHEVWVGHIFGQLPPKFSLQESDRGVMIRWENPEAWYYRKNRPEVGDQYYTGKFYPWIVYVRQRGFFKYGGAFKTREKALLSAYGHLGGEPEFGVKATTYTPPRQTFEEWLRNTVDTAETSGTHKQKVKALLKVQEILVFFDELKASEERLLKDLMDM